MPIRSGAMQRPSGCRCGKTLRQRYDEVGLPCNSTMGSPCPTSTYAISRPRTRRRCFLYGNAAEIMFASPVVQSGTATPRVEPPVLRLLVEKFAEKFDDVLASGVGRFGIIGDRDATFDTGVVESGGLARIAVDDHALLLFLETAFARGHRLRELHHALDRLVVENMMGTGIFNEG